jgi:hypothetical protein
MTFIRKLEAIWHAHKQVSDYGLSQSNIKTHDDTEWMSGMNLH